MIVGTHNNVKGIPGKGKKFAEKLLSSTRFEFYGFEVYEQYRAFFKGDFESLFRFTKKDTHVVHPLGCGSWRAFFYFCNIISRYANS